MRVFNLVLVGLAVLSLEVQAQQKFLGPYAPAKPVAAKQNYVAKPAARSSYAGPKKANYPAQRPLYASRVDARAEAPAVQEQSQLVSSSDTSIGSNFLRSNESPSQLITISPMVGTYALVGVQAGFKSSVQIVDDGFIGPLNDSVSVELGYFRGHWFDLQRESLEVTMRWDFNLLSNWQVYGAPGMAYERHWVYKDSVSANPDVRFAVGTIYSVARNFALRAEYDGFEAAFRAGLMAKM